MTSQRILNRPEHGKVENSGFTFRSTPAILWKYSLRRKSTLTVTERLMVVFFKLIYC